MGSIPTTSTFRVLLVDDHDIWRSGLISMLSGSEFIVTGEARTSAEALPAARTAQPEAALLDIRLADGDGFEVLTALKEEFPDLPVLMLTTYESPTFMARALAAGACGYLLKGVTRSELLDALRRAVRGEQLLAPEELIRSLRTVSEKTAESSEVFTPLSKREEEVVRLVATGLGNREIAQILYIAEGTVKSHVEHILKKVGAMDRVQLAVWAARHGLVREQEMEMEMEAEG